MAHDIQKADLWKRIAAWMFDGILTGILAVGIACLLSVLLGYDAHSQTLDEAYARYETQYGVTFDISQEEYLAMPEEARQNYDTAYEALTADGQAMHAYNMVMNLSLVITTLGILLGMLVTEFFLPLFLGNGQTLGKKIFGLCLVRTDGVKLNHLQLFTRTLLGKFTLETMIPVYVLLMLFWGTVGLLGTVALFVLGIAQIVTMGLSKTNAAIHDLLAGTAVVDFHSQHIFRTTEDLIAYQKQIAAERSARQAY